MYFPQSCTNYGTVQETGDKSPVFICGGQAAASRESHVLSTSSPRVNVSFFTETIGDASFLVHFEGSLTVCELD